MDRSSKYNHYIRKINPDGTPISQNYTNIEEQYTNLRYLKATGLNDVGKSKNIYMENYAESDRARVYIPPDGQYVNEQTDITMTFVVLGSELSRQSTIRSFTEELRQGIHTYYDDARYAAFDFVVVDDIKVSDEKWVGSQPYVELEIKMKNLNGKTRNVRPQQ
jgi:hypothetical protein